MASDATHDPATEKHHSATRVITMFKKILIANRGENGRAAVVSSNRLPQPALRAATRCHIA
ncbi:MAG: hypothetical protein AB7E10_07825 [Burkholderiaceae bacterium]|uniref:hypothetical protein n=1 Tax=Extensimonas perlucida TaxID=2590786 RepID=UPI00119F4AEF|nr:hypothetical protein [Extensimonas perlucida]